LYLTGTETTIRRVTAETNYSCLMLKTQRFSSLFRHYAKYHGLRKDDLEYYFVNLLENEDTPESVQLQRSDTIMVNVNSRYFACIFLDFYLKLITFILITYQVRKRRKPEPPEVAADDDEFFTDMKELLNDEEHMDAVFNVHPSSSDHSPTSDNNSGIIDIARGTGGSNLVSRNQFNTIIGDYNSKTDIIDRTSMIMDSNANTDPTTLSSSSSSMIVDEVTSLQSPIEMIQIRAHKSVLTARAEYFKALFRKNTAFVTNSGNTTGGKVTAVVGTDASTTIPLTATSTNAFKESMDSTVNVEPIFREVHIHAVLEFIYTNRITNLRKLPTDDVLSILHLSDKWLLRDLKRICEHELVRSHLTVLTVARLYGATEAFNAKRLSRACIDFIMSNLRQVTGNTSFLEEMKNFPHLMLPVLKAAADIIPEGPIHKKQRMTTLTTPNNVPNNGMHDPHSAAAVAAAHAGSPSSAAVAAVGVASFRSSPVPDSDA
jgi:BTB/POZ domain